MTGDDWIKLTNELPDGSRVTLTGGEPVVFKDFKRVFDHVAKKFECNMITNGILLNEELIDFLLTYKKFKVLSISIDNKKIQLGKMLTLVKKNGMKMGKSGKNDALFSKKKKRIRS